MERSSEAGRHVDWLWGWDPTPGIVSVWAEADGRATIWRRRPHSATVIREVDHFRPWVMLDSLRDLRHLDPRQEGKNLEPAELPYLLSPDVAPREVLTYATLRLPEGAKYPHLRYVVSAGDGRWLTKAILQGASQRLQRSIHSLRELAEDDGPESVLWLPPEEQYLTASGRTYFRDLQFADLRRMQIDLETTGLSPEKDRIFMIAVRDPAGEAFTLEADDESPESEAKLLQDLVEVVRQADPDIVENHNLHGFDLPFLEARAKRLDVSLALGRYGDGRLQQRAAKRGSAANFGEGEESETSRGPKIRYIAPGRELIDTMDAVMRYDFATRELPGHGLKAVARHLGLAKQDRVELPGAKIYEIYCQQPDLVRRYAVADVEEVAGLAELLGGAAFALAKMAPRRYERLADAGAATGVIDPMLVRAYLREGVALPTHQAGDGTPHSGAALHLFASGVAKRVVKADVASLYPSLMRAYRIGPARDHLGALLALVDQLVEQRLAAKAAGKRAAPGSAERHAQEAISAAMKLVVNSAYGYLAAGGGLTRFADVHAANQVTQKGRQTLQFLCQQLERRGVTLLEADTDGVYFAVPESWDETEERRVVQEVDELLPELVRLEFEGRYAAMLSHEPKNYALLGYDGKLQLRGVAFRSSRAEPFGEQFLKLAIGRLLAGDVVGVREAFVESLQALRGRELPPAEVASKVRLTKSAAQYAETRDRRKEAPYEALLAAGRESWRVGERIYVYRRKDGSYGLVEAGDLTGARDYDVEHYTKQLRETYAARMMRAFAPEDFAAVFAWPEQPSLFSPPVAEIRPILQKHEPMADPG